MVGIFPTTRSCVRNWTIFFRIGSQQRQYALERDIQVLEFPAHWNQLGRRAGMVRNREMLEAADAVVVFWDSVSKGTANMVEITQKAGLPLRIVRY